MASEKVTAIIEELKVLTVLELSELVKAVEEEFGVSAAAARILCKFADSHDNFKVKSGFLDGKVVDVATIESLAKLPSKEILLATVLGAFQAPIAAFARAVQAIVDKGDSAAE